MAVLLTSRHRALLQGGLQVSCVTRRGGQSLRYRGGTLDGCMRQDEERQIPREGHCGRERLRVPSQRTRRRAEA